MAYYLGIDLGTTYTAAAIERGGTVEALTLGNRSASVPSVVFLRDDGEILVGEAATRRASTDPGRVAREFKRRVGDPTPLILGGTPYAAEMLMARMLRWSLDRVHEQQGGPPQGMGLTHPANWGPYKLDLLRAAVRQVDVNADVVIPEPVAAATFYASQRRLDPGAVVAVYDLGGGTFDAAMVRRTPHGFESMGSPEGMERLGGIDFDEAVFAHVREAAGDALESLDPEEPAAVAAVTRLRQECIDAKEALSSDTDVSIPVLLPNLQTEVRLTRSEFESMIRPAINETIVALRRSIRSAKVSNEDVNAVLLVGGSSRIPLVAQMVGAELGRPIAIDAHPKDAISFGAAIAAAQRTGRATPESVRTVLPPDTRPPPPTMAATNRGWPGATPGVAAAGAVARPAPPTQGGQPPARPAPPTQGGQPPARPAPPGTQQPPTRPAQPGAPPGGRPAQPGPTPAAPAGGRPAQPGAPGPASGERPVPGQGGPGAVPGQRPPGAPGPAQRPAPPGASPMGGNPAASPGGPGAYQQPAHARAAQSSGGFPAAPSGGQDNRTLWIVVGVVAVIAAILVVVAITQSGGDDETSTGSGGGGSSETTATTEAPSGEGYTEAMEANFMRDCTAADDSPGAQDQCQCAYDAIREEIPVADMMAMEEEMANSSSEQLPPEIMEVVAPCLTAGGA